MESSAVGDKNMPLGISFAIIEGEDMVQMKVLVLVESSCVKLVIGEIAK